MEFIYIPVEYVSSMKAGIMSVLVSILSCKACQNAWCLSNCLEINFSRINKLHTSFNHPKIMSLDVDSWFHLTETITKIQGGKQSTRSTQYLVPEPGDALKYSDQIQCSSPTVLPNLKAVSCIRQVTRLAHQNAAITMPLKRVAKEKKKKLKF